MHEKPIMLIVNASEMDRRYLKKVFFGEYEFIEAKNGKEALAILRGEQPVSIILLDAIMPEMNGFQLLEILQEDSDFSGTPIVMVTSQDDEYTEIKALELGAVDFIAKPFKSQIIRRRVKNIVVKNKLEFKHKSKYDGLTGIYAKDAFFEKTSKMLRENTHKTYVILRWNIERFKLINDLFGTKEGDKVLVEMAKALAGTMNGVGTYGRIGEDHFVMCFPYNLLDIEDSIKRVNDWFGRYKADYAVVSNFGIYVVDDITLPVDIMCDRANLALQSVKGNIIKPYAFYEDKYRSSLLKEQSLIKDINMALDMGQFEVYYQPIFSLSLGRVIRAEALARWNHPTKSIIPAGQFISIFEKNGFIIQLDIFMLESVCKQLKEWKESGEELLPVSVNISTVSIYAQNFCNKLVEIVKKYGIEPSMVELEITENAYAENASQHTTTIKDLQKYGFPVIMDDFGSGYSAFNMLKDVPVDAVKIDLRFLEHFDKSDRFGSIITAVVRMGKWLNMPVIAVGVETKGQVDFLKSIGCDMIQGYFFSRPLPIGKFKAFVRKSLGFLNEKMTVYDGSINYNELFNPNFVSDQIINCFIGGIGIYELAENDLEIIRVNEGYYKTMGYTPQTLTADTRNILCKVFEEDRVLLIEKCRNICLNHGMGDIILRRYDANEKLLWLDVSIKYLGGSAERPLLCFVFRDITAQIGSRLSDSQDIPFKKG